ncbi:signal recognition particle-docking protein FtsY [Polynucleobacter sp. MWH-Spelu-300-X4]|uniref:signal recognition particle-docking protein FtsY n=1 Tax=Polynucleobacter sp. MWH-Spelu-300-X4 TaxID=2689109 RepID=UPI001BFED044|nr:signal recognition particle-docking protein FtsY [Polynucleobacter sp. MWH-Spelu-300-X4]QWD79654.1 signal recognition particle-docking protein FtsY [Polynucleobacter sp. MWH-Spelu-300-X4]
MFGLRKTLSSLFSRQKIDEEWYDSLEEALLLGDVGMKATQSLIASLRAEAKKQKAETVEELKELLAQLIENLLKRLERPLNPLLSFQKSSLNPQVWIVVGVNGAGKTTSIGKLCHYFQASGHKVLLGAGDTFRAAAREQLMTWGERNQVAVITQQGGDAAAVAHDSVKAGQSRNMDLVVIDTAGRLSTQANLMDELKKVKRVTAKAQDDAPNETILVIDGNTGQNGLSQVKAFHEALGLTAIIVTKLDGTAKGGILCAIAEELPENTPSVIALGLGEGIDDLKPFSASEFAKSLVP